MIEKPKKRWAVRLAFAFVVFCGIVAVVHAVWTTIAVRGVRQRVAALQAAGEPILPADFATTQPAGADDAGPDIAEAIAIAEAFQSPDDEWFEDIDLGLPLRPNERKAIADGLTLLAAADEALDRAIALPRAEWEIEMTSPVITNTMLPRMNGLRRLVNLQAAAVLLAHEDGDDAEMIRRLERAAYLGRYAGRHPSLVGHLVGIGCVAAVSNRVTEVAPDFRIGSRPGDASPDDVRRVIDMLLDEAPQRESFVRALRAERMSQLDAIESLAIGQPMPGPMGRSAAASPLRRVALWPILYGDARFMLDHMTKMMPATQKPDLPSAQAVLPPRPPRSMLHLFSGILLPSLERAFEVYYRSVTDRRLAATALALRWYAVEHDGKLPETLDALVPRYVPAMPVDAIVADGRSFGYAPDGAEPILWSVGANGKDDGGRDTFTKPPHDRRRPGQGDPWSTLDRVVHLVRQPRPEPEPEFEYPVPQTQPATSEIPR